MSYPLFVLKSKTYYQGSPQQIRIELEPLVDSESDYFWGDPKNPNGRCEFYIAASEDINYPIGRKFRIALLSVLV